MLAAMDDELLLVVTLGRAAEDTAFDLVRVLDVLEPPRRPQRFQSQRLYRKKPSMPPMSTTNDAISAQKVSELP